jgi:four helix bundle protein
MSDMNFHSKLKGLIHKYILLTYKLSKKYPSDERFGLTSQDRRSAVSVMLNNVEGYARMRPAVQLNFCETAFASLKESIYCRYLAKELGYISQEEYDEAFALKEKIAPMLYKTMEGLRRKRK